MADVIAALESIVVGDFVTIEKTSGRGEKTQQRAEILSIRNPLSGGGPEYYVHYDGFNKRLDEWVLWKKLNLDSVEHSKGGSTTSGGHGTNVAAASATKNKSSPPSKASAITKSGSSDAPTVVVSQRQPSSSSSSKQAAAAVAPAMAVTPSKDTKKRKRLSGLNRKSASPEAGDNDDVESVTNGKSSSGKENRKLKYDTPIAVAGPDVDMEDVESVDTEPVKTRGSKSNTRSKDKDDDEDNDVNMEDANENNDGTKDGAGEDTVKNDDDEEDETFSKEKELEKLRTGGSMTQSIGEVSRVKNINRIIMGKHEVDTWYFSPYPEEFAGDCLYICEFCLEFAISTRAFERHRQKCTLHHPPGNEIYRKHDISFWEIDGRKQKKYCRNLCLLSKLFLDHKTLYYDVDPFLFYLMTNTDETGCHLLGYFSKEKQSSEEYNVACILTLPQYQRMGYGKMLISFSYELSKIEGKAGSPEKPLSDLGLLSYRKYWTDIIIEKLYQIRPKGEISIHELSQQTSITPDDILSTLHSLDLLKFYRNSYVFFLTQKNIEYAEKNMKKVSKNRVEKDFIDWTPPKFQPSQLRFL
ncbi:hypothetical protein SmJEL517_g04474 [Synchytrium microbalum]|uniref:histone acetyltransferase n=1 Tax=Synchytrium microbalum TaxID=1806994 RepID=A0A507BS43_9FUNG|nr:uncharacterized protein SmJEL517_g04474 [Synchytrium microbalum]TPX32460.1 hypothetical protein SmJEL517_g04474 [Synchytrium microbalum]